MEHDKLCRGYYGNNGSRCIAVKYLRADGVMDWYELPGGPFDWGTMGARGLRLAFAILADMGVSTATQLMYAQKVLVNVVAMNPRERPFVVSEATVLERMGCKAIDDLCKVEP